MARQSRGAGGVYKMARSRWIKVIMERFFGGWGGGQ